MAGPTPIEWTDWRLNAIRGICKMGCEYCVSGDILILMADCSWKQMKDIQIGDKIIGIGDQLKKGRKWKRFQITEIKNKWERIAEAVELIIDNGIQMFPIVCSLDHKWLTADHRTWRKTNILNFNSKLAALNTHAEYFPISNEYKKGYLAGIIDGDATMGVYKDKRIGREKSKIYSFRLAMKDEEAINRTENYMKDFGIITNRFIFKYQHGSLMAIRLAAKSKWMALKQITQFKNNKEFLRGYLGGMYDAEGSLGKDTQRIIRISNYAESNLRKIILALDKWKFRYVRESKGIRLFGGRNSHVRFINIADPVIERKRNVLKGLVLKGRAKMISIKKWGTCPLFDIETGTGNFIANGLISHNCYAKKMYRRFKWDPTVRLVMSEFDTLPEKPIKIFLCSTHELFGNWIPYAWIDKILHRIEDFPQHTFQILTKCPERANKFNFPRNVWMGMTITGKEPESKQEGMFRSLLKIKAKIRFVSFEPLLAKPAELPWEIFDWLIIGGQTQPTKIPDMHWIESIICPSKYVKKTPIFLKNNLDPSREVHLRQEFPEIIRSR